MQILAILVLTQMPWTSHLPERGIAFDFLRPKFDVGGTSLTTGAAYLSARFPTGGGFAVRAQVPFAHLSASGVSSSAFGNPYIGLESTRGRVEYGLGFRPALTPDDEFAGEVGLFTDITQLEAWVPHLATLAGTVTYRNQTSTGMTVELGGGPSAWIPTDGGDTELILNHHGSIGHRGSKVWMGLGLGGVLVMTEEGDFGERSFYQLGASVGLTQGQVRPALHVLLPLDDAITSDVDFVIGLGVAIAIK